MDAFKQRYREEFDVLLVDDIQFLAGKERHPGGVLPHLQHALRERPAARADVRPRRRARSPSSTTACARASSGACSSTCSRPTSRRASRSCTSASRPTACASPTPRCCRAIARRVPTNIRELEGALTRVLAYASLTGRPATAALVRETLHDLPGRRRARSRSRPSSRSSPRRSAIPVAELGSAKRSQAVVAPRQIAMYLCRELTDASLPRDRPRVRRPRPHDRAVRGAEDPRRAAPRSPRVRPGATT